MKLKKYILLPMVAMACIFTSCSNHPSFKTSEEAIEACKKELKDLRGQKSVDIKKLTELTSGWLELQDSAYSVFAKDSMMTLKNPAALAYFLISDSIRTEITRLAVGSPRSMEDVMYLKLNSARGREKVEESETFKEAVDFYKRLDEEPTFTTLQETFNKYTKLLGNVKGFKKEDDFIKFIAAEDKCFRSLMQDLSLVSPGSLQVLTDGTSKIFEKFYSVIGKKHNDLDDRTMLYLTMRFNRRIIQNAEACVEDIENGKKLDNVQKANYRWMLVQPFMSIDDYSVAVLTDGQKEALTKLAGKLPSMLQKLDIKKYQEQSEENITNVLAMYFLKSYLATTL